MAVMVAGGTGYIGSHTVAELLKRGREVVVADSLIKGHKQAVAGGSLYIGDIRDETFMDKVLHERRVLCAEQHAASAYHYAETECRSMLLPHTKIMDGTHLTLLYER